MIVNVISAVAESSPSLTVNEKESVPLKSASGLNDANDPSMLTLPWEASSPKVNESASPSISEAERATTTL